MPAIREPLRPPVYNPEDYAISLKKWGRKTNSGMQLPLYLSQSTGSIEKLSSDGSLHDRGHSTSSTKSSSSTKTSDEKHSKKEKDFTLKMEKKELKNKENVLHRGTKNDLNVDFRNPILTLTNQEGEMSLRQFSSVTELLGKLKVDLQLSFPSFVQEFVGDPVDGVTLLLELLRAVQLSQASQQQKRPPQIFRRALLDEHSCLICLKHCLRCSDATRRLVSSPAGLFTLAVCIMSNVTQSRIIALELLTKACEIPGSGHKAVSEALSTLRLRFGEPVRFRFLVGMLNSAGTIELLATAMKFINVFVETASNIQQKVYIQAELEQAGFDAKTLRKTLPCNSESVKLELNKWEKSYFDVETLQNNVVEVNSLHEKIELLEKRIEILQEEKGILQSLEQCLKERCSELEEEVSIKTNTTTKSPSTKQFNNFKFQPNKRSTEKGESTPAEDEGISSSEQELSQDEDYVKTDIPYNTNTNEFGQTANSTMKTLTLTKDRCKSSNKSQENNAQACCNLKNYKNTRSSKMTETNVDDGNEIIRNEGESNEEEETTIDEVIEELENIVNNAETQAYAIEEKKYKLQSAVPVRVRQETATDDKARIYASQEKDAFEETEIVPSLLHPQPPRKAKSLVHIYFSGRDFDSQENTKNEFFDEDTDTESSDSLLTATREKRSMNRNYNRSLNITDSFGSFSSNNTRTLFIKNDDEYVDNEMNIKQCFEERNIDEEEIKRKQTNGNIHYKDEKIRTENFTSPIFFKDNRFGGDTKKPVFQKDFISERITMRGSMDRLNEKGYTNCYEKTTYFHGIKPCKGEQSGNDVLTGRMQKYPPAPVKRSQTFHITSDSDTMYKRSEMKPKPKMGVSGLDFQRNTEQKIKSDHGKYQSIEYRKNFERKPDASDRYSRRMSKDSQKYHPNETQQGTDLYRRGSFDGVFSLTEVTENRVMRMENSSVPGYQNESSVEKPCAKIRSKSLEKMDEGLDSLVDIVIATDECKKPKPRTESTQDVGKNIGPRTRRSLAESSLFSPPRERLLMKPEETPKPPKPAQRTSLTRHNSSSNTHHVPGEVKLAPVQPNPRQQIVYNFGMKSSKSEDSLFSGIKRCPPDGSSSPMEFKAKTESQISSDDASTSSPLYSTAVKPPKTFGNSKFDYGRGEVSSNQTYFGSDYSEGTLSTGKPVSPMPRNIQNGSGLNVKSFGSNSTEYKPVPTKSTGSKPNFLLGTYQSQATKNIPKPSSSVLNSINTFNNSILVKKPTGNTKIYASPRVNGSGFSSSVQKGHNPDGANRKSNAGNGSMAEKVTDSPSGLY
ncbi:hypothetical protein RUM43_004568 [Polyplax serrata]|uniref:GBD/FH3 domain-containing protein n=1 Tax=Polyplax serrata TaxID=468196 RepID=A0AAN8SAZ9_POLSC